MVSICSPLLSPFTKSWIVNINWVSQERDFRNPCCASLSIWWPPRWEITWLCTWLCSSVPWILYFRMRDFFFFVIISTSHLSYLPYDSGSLYGLFRKDYRSLSKERNRSLRFFTGLRNRVEFYLMLSYLVIPFLLLLIKDRHPQKAYHRTCTGA